MSPLSHRWRHQSTHFEWEMLSGVGWLAQLENAVMHCFAAPSIKSRCRERVLALLRGGEDEGLKLTRFLSPGLHLPAPLEKLPDANALLLDRI